MGNELEQHRLTPILPKNRKLAGNKIGWDCMKLHQIEQTPHERHRGTEQPILVNVSPRVCHQFMYSRVVLFEPLKQMHSTNYGVHKSVQL